MKQIKLLLFIIACTNIFAACKKDKNTTDPADQLPPATQTGANTFGCLVNGKVYVPAGYTGTTKPNPHVIYEIGLNGSPTLTINADKYDNSYINKGYFFFSIGNLNHLGNYFYPNDVNFLMGWLEQIGNCGTPSFDTTVKKWGGIITKLDIPNRIISGTFDCKYKTLQCDTVFITDGRFDIKF
jgi:hypothetical protein